MNSNFLAETIGLIRNRPRPMTYKTIGSATGIPVQFLQDLMAGRIKNPGVARIESLYNHMSATKLTFVTKQLEFVPTDCGAAL